MKIIKLLIKNIKGIKSEKLKVKTWFCDKDLSSVNLLSKTHDFIKNINGGWGDGWVEGWGGVRRPIEGCFVRTFWNVVFCGNV